MEEPPAKHQGNFRFEKSEHFAAVNPIGKRLPGVDTGTLIIGGVQNSCPPSALTRSIRTQTPNACEQKAHVWLRIARYRFCRSTDSLAIIASCQLEPQPDVRVLHDVVRIVRHPQFTARERDEALMPFRADLLKKLVGLSWIHDPLRSTNGGDHSN